MVEAEKQFAVQMTYARCSAYFFIVLCGVLYPVGNLFFVLYIFSKPGTIAKIVMFSTYYGLEFFQFCCLIVWGCTLSRLYKEVKVAKDVLPSQNVFRLHGTFLVLYLAFNIGATIAF